MKNIISTVALAAATLTLPAGAAELPAGAVKNVVLVHGAFADATSWGPVAAILRDKGFTVTQVDNPLTSLADDVTATTTVLAKQDGPTVLVGHSWGGVVIGESGNDDKVAALVYVSAFAPDKGESLAKLGEGHEPTSLLQALQPDDRGFLSIVPAKFRAAFAADVPEAEAAVMAQHQLPVNGTVFAEEASVAAWHDKPTYFVISAQDKGIDPATQRFFAERMGAQVTEIQASHAALISKAADVAAVIEAAAVAAGK